MIFASIYSIVIPCCTDSVSLRTETADLTQSEFHSGALSFAFLCSVCFLKRHGVIRENRHQDRHKIPKCGSMIQAAGRLPGFPAAPFVLCGVSIWDMQIVFYFRLGSTKVALPVLIHEATFSFPCYEGPPMHMLEYK